MEVSEPYPNRQNSPSAPAQSRAHTLWVVDRKELTVKGVTEVLSFDETAVDLVTACGRMTVQGRDLRVTVLDTAGGTVSLTGLVCGILYEAPSDGTDTARDGKKHRLARLLR